MSSTRNPFDWLTAILTDKSEVLGICQETGIGKSVELSGEYFNYVRAINPVDLFMPMPEIVSIRSGNFGCSGT